MVDARVVFPKRHFRQYTIDHIQIAHARRPTIVILLSNPCHAASKGYLQSEDSALATRARSGLPYVLHSETQLP